MDGPCQAVAAALTDLRLRHVQAQALLGWAMKRDPPNFAVLAALDAILDARPIRRYVPPGTELPEWLHDKRAAPGEPRQHTIPRDGEWAPSTSQRAIMQRVAQGGNDADIAADLGLSHTTFRRRLTKMLPLMGVSDRVVLAVEAHRRGYID